jgi:acyl carrier protein
MDQIRDRLRDCFRMVFFDLSDEQIESAVRAELPEWDSLATVTLLTVVEEEFELELDDQAVEQFDSFPAIERVVQRIGS